MSYKIDMRKLAIETMDKLNAIDVKIEKLSANIERIAPEEYRKQRYQLVDLRANIVTEALNAADILCDRYLDDVRKHYMPNGEMLNADADILKSGMQLTDDEVAEMYKRNAGNITMQRLIVEYAEKHNIEMPFTPITTETMRGHIEYGKLLRKYFSSALLDAGYYADIWKDDSKYERISAGLME